jgi:endoplasmic reticulum chaperone BiP
MTIDVYEGERSQTKYNHLLGLFELTDIPPAPRGETEVRITYKVDVNGMLEVTASLVGGSNKKTVIIEPESGRLSQSDIDRMLKEAQRFASEDKTTRERIESRNSLESSAYDITSQLDQIDSDGDESIAYLDAKKSLSEKIEETLLWLESNEEAEKDEVDSKYSELQAISNPFLRRYKNSENRHADETLDDEL